MVLNTILENHPKKVGEHTPCGNSMSTVWVFNGLVEALQLRTKFNFNFELRVEILQLGAQLSPFGLVG